MTKMVIACLLVVGVLAFAATAFPAERPTGVAPLQYNQAGTVASAGSPVPYSTTNCGDYTCANNGSCCGNRTCCPSGFNIYCRNNNKCYNSISAAQAACGNSYYICASPVQ